MDVFHARPIYVGTTVERTALGSALDSSAYGYRFFDTDDVVEYYWDGSTWQVGGGAIGEGPGISIVGNVVGIGGNTILIYYADGSPVDEFPATEAGFAAALAAGDANDVRVLPIVTIPGNHTIAVPVLGISNLKSILSGKITGAAGCVLNNLHIERTANDANDLIGFESAAVCYIGRCNVSCVQSGTGNVYGIKSLAGGLIYSTSNRITGQSTGGNGYAAYAAGGDIHALGGKMEYSTAATLGDVEVYATQMDTVTGVPLAGDRAAWDATSYGSLHAKDIADSAPQRHAPLPGVVGNRMKSDGTNWLIEGPGLSNTYTFGGGASGDVASMTFVHGMLTVVTVVP